MKPRIGVQRSWALPDEDPLRPQLGIAFVWINRYNDAHIEGVDILEEFADLIGFARRAFTS